MGHREELLAAAKRCLRERGYARITARDLVAESDTNLASIGYHFGSKEELLSAALIEMVGEWADTLEGALGAGAAAAGGDGREQQGPGGRADGRHAPAQAGPGEGHGAGPYDRFHAVWNQVLDTYPEAAGVSDGLEALAQARHSPAIRQRMADGYEEGRQALATWFHQGPPADADEARAVGGFYLALLTGVLLQRGIDPQRAPDADDLTRALRRIVADYAADTGGTAEPAGPEGGAQAPPPS